ncbi:MAG: hypothetical protein KDB53_17010 [Planctomycetes bacterium]|nr:hypothetical protein [Planctomycetota bacterium]
MSRRPTQRRSPPPVDGPEAEMEQLVRRLAEVARRVFLSRPHAKDVARSLPALNLEWTIDFSGRESRVEDQAARLMEQLVTHVDDAILTHAAFRPGCVFCFFCERADCEHAAPVDCRYVFDGYRETGVPVWSTLLDQAIARGLDEMDELSRDRGAVVLIHSDRKDLVGGRLEAFSRADRVYDLRGQIAIGYQIMTAGGGPRKFAVSLQVVRSTTRSRVVRLGLNTVGLLPDGREALGLLDGSLELPYVTLVREAAPRLARINQDLKRLPPGDRFRRASEEADRLLHDMASGFTRHRRRESWRTGHASLRAAEKDRPTGMARREGLGARPERSFWDEREGTFVVLGGRGRTHVFSVDGLHVTSLHLDRRSIEARLEKRRWRPLDGGEVAVLLGKMRAAFDGANGDGPEV